MIIRGKCAFSQLKWHWLLCAPANWWINYDVSHLCEIFFSDLVKSVGIRTNLAELEREKNQKEFILCISEKDINSFDENTKDYSIIICYNKSTCGILPLTTDKDYLQSQEFHLNS